MYVGPCCKQCSPDGILSLHPEHESPVRGIRGSRLLQIQCLPLFVGVEHEKVQVTVSIPMGSLQLASISAQLPSISRKAEHFSDICQDLHDGRDRTNKNLKLILSWLEAWTWNILPG